jgi:hypothetical protein
MGVIKREEIPFVSDVEIIVRAFAANRGFRVAAESEYRDILTPQGYPDWILEQESVPFTAITVRPWHWSPTEIALHVQAEDSRERHGFKQMLRDLLRFDAVFDIRLRSRTDATEKLRQALVSAHESLA